MKSFRDGLIAAVNEHMHGKLGWLLGVIHNPRGRLRGEGVSQITILLHKPYFDHAEGRGTKTSKNWTSWFMDGSLLERERSCGLISSNLVGFYE